VNAPDRQRVRHEIAYADGKLAWTCACGVYGGGPDEASSTRVALAHLNGCRKMPYASKALADRALYGIRIDRRIEALSGGKRRFETEMRSYQCWCGMWHLTSHPERLSANDGGAFVPKRQFEPHPTADRQSRRRRS